MFNQKTNQPFSFIMIFWLFLVSLHQTVWFKQFWSAKNSNSLNYSLTSVRTLRSGIQSLDKGTMPKFARNFLCSFSIRSVVFPMESARLLWQELNKGNNWRRTAWFMDEDLFWLVPFIVCLARQNATQARDAIHFAGCNRAGWVPSEHTTSRNLRRVH